MKNRSVIIDNVEVTVIRKPIKNLHLRVYPPDGRVSLAVPKNCSDKRIHLVITNKLDWIKKKQADLLKHTYPHPPEWQTGEKHYFLGEAYDLQIIHSGKKPNIYLINEEILIMDIPSDSCKITREKLMHDWYRHELQQTIPDLIATWEPIIGKKVKQWGIRKMKTRWGTCNPAARRIWLNLELAKAPLTCLNYVLVHEMVHFYERGHNDNFYYYMDKFMPDWRNYRDALNAFFPPQ